MDDPHDLQRFVTAQDQSGTYESAVTELRAGRKTGHWMWFVFPQIAGLGQSPMSRRYALRSLNEARAYLAHPVLGPRLIVSYPPGVGTLTRNQSRSTGRRLNTGFWNCAICARPHCH